jgi:putative aminopeptidase FrvX
MKNEPTQEILLELLTIPGVSGDEGAIADWLENVLTASPMAKGKITLSRIGDNVIAVRGKPKTAVFAHTDTVGFTLGYRDTLIHVGSPKPEDRDLLKSESNWTARLRKQTDGDGGESWVLRRVRNEKDEPAEAVPGSRWVYAREPKMENGFLTSPYLDNRAGVWTALRCLYRCENIAVAFTTGEEQHGQGARICADHLYRTLGITQALIADITWHTEDTPCGKGVVVSLRDAFCPRQRILDRVLRLAEESKVAVQREIQSAGSSDGGHILRSPVPMDWVFIGAPEMEPHTSREQLSLNDLDAMTDLLTHLTNEL